jgi:serine/threonine protein phosphatase PrpC
MADPGTSSSTAAAPVPPLVLPERLEPARCPRCGDTSDPKARFCEACGHDFAGQDGTVPAPLVADTSGQEADFAAARIATSANPPARCAGCDGTGFAAQPDGGTYCENCGKRRAAGRPHAEADLEVIAVASDIGKRHHHNEDAFGIVRLPQAYAGVVCDGVSSSSRADTASHAAADAATRAFARTLDTSPADSGDAQATIAATIAATMAAVDAAQAAAASAGSDQAAQSGGPPGRERRPDIANPASTTFVSAVVTPDAVTIGWVGDSRAYWLAEDGEAACLTVDDTLGSQLAAAGIEVSEATPNAAALTRWLGSDATDTVPHVASFAPSGPGRVIVCSDGLFRYAPEAAALAAVTSKGTAIDVARALVQFALDAGGGDNVTVIVMPYPPAVPTAEEDPAAQNPAARNPAAQATPQPKDQPR